MRFLLSLALAAACFAQTQPPVADPSELPDVPELNVNARYRVESVEFVNHQPAQLSGAISEEIQNLIGQRVNVDRLDRLTGALRDALKARSVTFTLARGTQPAAVRVLFLIEKRPANFEVTVPQLSYLSGAGWSGGAQARIVLGANAFSVAALSNGDDLVERYSGVRLRFERLSFGSDKIRAGFEFDTYRERYSSATITALLNPAANLSLGAGAYSSRLNFEPSATFAISRPLTVMAGVSFETLQPEAAGARTQTANALTASFRYHERLGETDASRQDIDGIYNIRSATAALGSDLTYTRQMVSLRYKLRHDRHSASVAVMAGVIYGKAPLFERFVLGNSTTLRGWNKYDLDPLGGNRMVHGSVTYGYRLLRVFYDLGSVWDRGKTLALRSSVGAGVTTSLGFFGKDALLLAIAFPIRDGRVVPAFVAGMNF